jgi:hypothetical protein
MFFRVPRFSPVSFHHSSILIFICMLLLPEALSGKSGALDGNVLPLVHFKGEPSNSRAHSTCLLRLTEHDTKSCITRISRCLRLGSPSGRLKPRCTANTVRRVQYRYYPEALESVTDGRDFQNAVSANVCRLVENCTVLYKHY